ncbi:MAG: septum formation protein Maf [Hyphomicrobiaceae bacterium]|nr:septum formation protein Maf [Hyphomicrobiaceae bacterium]
MPHSIILASSSPTRRRLLKAAGIDFTADAACVDEAVVRETLTADGETVEPGDLAEILARAKAEDVSARHPEAVVIGADQVLSCSGELFGKPGSMGAARETLLALRGRTHQLHSAVAIAGKGEVRWAMVETAHLTMRAFSIAFLGSYLAQAGGDVLDSVGAYKLEGPGIQLFERIEGDYFSILGLPLLPLIGELRAREAIPE